VVRGENPTDLAVIPSSPADKAGVEENDIILEFDGQKLDLEHDLTDLIQERQIGDTVSLKILHDGEEKTVEVTLEERSAQ
jgi:S1-C subfamily serine protease